MAGESGGDAAPPLLRAPALSKQGSQGVPVYSIGLRLRLQPESIDRLLGLC